MSSHFRNRSAAFLLGLSLVILNGCRDSSPRSLPADASAGSGTAVEPDSLAALAALEKVQADLQRDTAGRITHVSFREVPLNDELLKSLAALPRLQNLSVSSCQLTMAGWQEVGELKQLRQLDLRDCPLGNEELAAAVSGLAELQVLKLSGKSGATTVDDAGMAALKGCSKLKVLAADFLWISDTGLAELTELKDLRELYLASSLVDDAALVRIAAIPSVRKLRIAKTGVGREGLNHLAQLKLEELDASECININDEALEPIGKIVTLKKLNLWRDAISDAGVAHLAGLTNLEWLNVDNTQVTDEGLRSFSGFSKLSFLHLGSTAVTDSGMSELTKLKSLKELKVTRTSVTEGGVQPLRQALPKIDIQLKYGEEE